MNKGFTLIELLAVIIILSIISLIVVVSVGSILSNTEESLYDIQVKQLEEAAEKYYLKEGMDLGISCINVSDLIAKGYIKGSKVLNPEDNTEMTGSIKITYSSNQYFYKYQNLNCRN